MIDMTLEPSSNGMIYGQDMCFLGFPYTLQDERHDQLNRNFELGI